jgi:Tfp pilus assembly protein PilN
MPLINLIQERKAAEQREERRAKACLFAFVGAVIVASGAYGSVSLLEAGALRAESQFRANMQKVAPRLLEIERTEREIAELQPRLETLQKAREASGRWTRILTHLVTQTPKESWLTNVRSAQPDDEAPVQISLMGMSSAQGPVGEFMIRMQSQRDLGDVTLKQTSEKVSSTGTGIEFEVTAAVLGTEQKKPRKSGKDGEEKDKEDSA